MKRILVISLCSVLIFLGCKSKQDKQTELQNIKNVVYGLFDDISDFNYQGIRDKCTDDFILFEDGQVMNIDNTIIFIKNFEGATLNYKFEDVKINLEGNIAWITLRNKAVMIMNEKQTNFEWVESSVLKRQNGVWKIAIYHSTVVKQPKE